MIAEAPLLTSEPPPRRRFPFAVLILAIGATLFLFGVGLVFAARVAPESASLRAVPGFTLVGVMALGVGGILAGMAGLLVGWGTPSGRPLPPGSHRAVILGTLAPIAFAIVASIAILALAPGSEGAETSVFLVAGSTMYLGLLAVVYVQGVRTGVLTRETLGLSNERIPTAVLWGLGGSLATLGVGALNELVLQGLGLPHPQLEGFEWLRGMPIGHFIMVAIGGAVVAPIVEELFFRGYVFNAYLAEKGPRVAYLASSALFAVVHGLPTLFIGIFGMGLVLAFLARRSGSLVAPIIAHMLNNSLAFVGLFASLQEPR
jgi:membrane protease YdiL (CAAX protease family)